MACRLTELRETPTVRAISGRTSSYSFTSVAILQLWDQKKIDLDAKAFSVYLSDIKPLPGATIDSRLADITVRMLLNHTGGWDRDISFDPMFRSPIVSAATNTQAPASTEAII